MEIKHYAKSSLVCWSNSKTHSELLASAALDPDPDNLYHLDLLHLDLQDRSQALQVVGNGYTNIPFRCVAWDVYGEKNSDFQNGLIFGGMEDGSYTLWNPAEMIATYSSRNPPSINNIEQQAALVYAEELEQSEDPYPILCAEWNALKPSVLAFGTTKVLILDLVKGIADSNLSELSKNKNPHHDSYITSVTWNKEVSHILASASQNGLIALWDVKKDESIFQFKDTLGPSGTSKRNVNICWSKTISTQIAVTLDDQKRNQLQIWDLRNHKGPIVVIDKGHHKGINAVDWCDTDPELILTAGRDNKIICWNYIREDPLLSETALDRNILEVRWSKKLPSIYSVCTDSKVSICTLNENNLFSYVPKWYKVPVGSTFFGNDTVLTFSENRGRVLHENHLQINTQDKSELKNRLIALEDCMAGKPGSQSGLADLIKAKDSNQGDSQIYKYLGLNRDKIVQQVEKYTGKKRQVVGGTAHREQAKQKSKAYTSVVGREANEFFAAIGTKNVQSVLSGDEDEGQENIKYDAIERNSNWDIGKQRLIKQNMLIGNYEGAIDAALKCGRTAEALIIAYSVDQNTFNGTLKTFFTQTTDNFITDILKYIASKDTDELVKKYDLAKWKECVALIYSLSNTERRAALLSLLASRLKTQAPKQDSAGQIFENNPAIICYILAQNFDQIVNTYAQNLKKFKSGSKLRKVVVVEYTRRLIAIINSMTVTVQDNRNFQAMLREVSYISLELDLKLLAYNLVIMIADGSSNRYLDYLIHCTPELKEYRGSIVFDSPALPVMHSKKKETKVKSKQGPAPNPRKKMFQPERKSESDTTNTPPPPPPPPVQHRRQEEPVNPPGPINIKKAISPSSVQQPTPPPPPPNKRVPPPSISNSSEPVQEPEPKQVMPLPVRKQHGPPPPPPPPVHRKFSEEEEPEQVQPQPKQPLKMVPVQPQPLNPTQQAPITPPHPPAPLKKQPPIPVPKAVKEQPQAQQQMQKQVPKYPDSRKIQAPFQPPPPKQQQQVEKQPVRPITKKVEIPVAKKIVTSIPGTKQEQIPQRGDTSFEEVRGSETLIPEPFTQPLLRNQQTVPAVKKVPPPPPPPRK